MVKDKISVIVILYFSKHLIKELVSNINSTVKDCGEIILINNINLSIEKQGTANK